MAFEKLGKEGFIVTGEQDTRLFRLMTLKSALGLEIKGLKMNKGRSAYAIIKAEFGLKGSKASVLEQFTAIVEQKKAERLTPACVSEEPNEQT